MALTPYPSLATLPEVVANAGKVPTSFLSSSASPSYLSLKYDLGIADDATITGVGSASFSNAGYGTLTLDARTTPIGNRPSETVTQRIQAALDLAASGPLGLIWDVRCSVGVQAVPGLSGDEMLTALTLRLPGNLHVVGRPGCGVILRAQTNAAVFSVESYSGRFGVPASSIGTDTQINTIGNIQFGNLLFEDLYVNVNSGTVNGAGTSAANQLSPTFGQAYYLNGMRLFGVQDVEFRGCSFVGGGGFHLYFGNWRRVRANAVTIDDLGISTNYGGNDCFHLNGPGDDFTARDCRLAVSDDFYAFNTADGNNHSGRNHGPSVPAWGSITRCRAFNTTIAANGGPGNVFRWMACPGCVNTGHEIDGITGSAYSLGQIYNAQSGTGPLGTLDLRNVDADFTDFGVRFFASNAVTIRRLGLSGFRRSGSNLDVPILSIAVPVGRLDIDGFLATDDGTSGSSLPQIQVTSGGSIGQFSATGVGLDGSTAGRVMPLLKIDSGATITLARLSNAGATNLAALIANAGTLSKLIASNIDPAVTILSGTAAAATKGDYYL